MRLIDADKLKIDRMTDKGLAISQSQIANAETLEVILTSKIENAIAQIIAERDFAYADFEQYKVDILGVDPEYVEDELPYDDFRYGMERCIEIIRKHTGI